MKRTLKNFGMRNVMLLLSIVGMILAWGVELRAETKPGLAILPFMIHRGEDPGERNGLSDL